MTDWERRALQQIETDLTAETPRLARRLRAPTLWARLVWGPPLLRVILVVVGLLLALGAIILISALTAGPATT
ncbi:MAG TPA: DUF3040 domain-containing protein [Actinocrinis sp.]|jgi:hypothetical protein